MPQDGLNNLEQLIRDLWDHPELHQRWEDEGIETLFEEYRLNEEQRNAFNRLDWKEYLRLGVHPFIGVIRWAMTEDGKRIHTMGNFLDDWEALVKQKTDV